LESAVAGLDIGTTSIKLVLYGQNGVFYSDRMNHSEPGADGREFDPNTLFNDIICLIRKACECHKDVIIKAIGISTFFPSFIALDLYGEPLTKIITWMDNRGDDLVSNFKKNEADVVELHEKTGCVVHESYTLWKILWLKEKQKQFFLKSSKFLTLPDYLTYKFTGKFVISYASASTTSLFNINSLKWDKEILAMAGIGESQLSECYSIFHSERILKTLKLKTGLNDDAIFVIGAGDGHLSNIGGGCVTDRTVCSTIGTSSALRIIHGSSIPGRNLWTHSLFDETRISGIATNAGSSTLSWVCRNVLHKPFENAFEYFDKNDGDCPEYLILLPFFDGERGPGYNQKMSASIFGLSSGCTDSDVYAAAVEGILFNLFDCYQILIEHTGKPDEMVATGGYISSEKMVQMQSDIFNIKIKVPAIRESSAVGAAILCLIALGEKKSLSDIKTVYEKIYYPNSEKHKMYMKKYCRYKLFYEISSQHNQ